METTEAERAVLAHAYSKQGEDDAVLRLIRDLDAVVGAVQARDETIGLCQSYASNTSGGMDAEARLRRIYKLCCRTRAGLGE
jgi:hypothetical protein